MNGKATTYSNGHATSNGIKRRAGVVSVSSKPEQTTIQDHADKQPLHNLSFWSRWEIPRKILHGSIGTSVCFRVTGSTHTELRPPVRGYVGFVTLGLYFLRPPRMDHIIIPLCGTLAVVASADAIRFKSVAFERLYEKLLGPLMRESEKVGEPLTRLFSVHFAKSPLSNVVFRQWRCLVSYRGNMGPYSLPPRRCCRGYLIVCCRFL